VVYSRIACITTADWHMFVHYSHICYTAKHGDRLIACNPAT